LAENHYHTSITYECICEKLVAVTIGDNDGELIEMVWACFCEINKCAIFEDETIVVDGLGLG